MILWRQYFLRARINNDRSALLPNLECAPERRERGTRDGRGEECTNMSVGDPPRRSAQAQPRHGHRGRAPRRPAVAHRDRRAPPASAIRPSRPFPPTSSPRASWPRARAARRSRSKRGRPQVALGLDPDAAAVVAVVLSLNFLSVAVVDYAGAGRRSRSSAGWRRWPCRATRCSATASPWCAGRSGAPTPPAGASLRIGWPSRASPMPRSRTMLWSPITPHDATSRLRRPPRSRHSASRPPSRTTAT